MGLGLPASVSFERLQAPFESASDAPAGFDERLRFSPVAEASVLRAKDRPTGRSGGRAPSPMQ